MNTIILATSNSGKIKELSALLKPITCISQTALGIESPDETGLSFVENALIKARHASHLSGKPALADDSGLVVPALGGEPGIYSARYAGEQATSEDNIQRLLENMAGIHNEARQAYFYCVIATVRYAADPTPLISQGQWWGVIAEEKQGEYGFGYDPIFYLPIHGCTAAQLPADLKNTVSHRAQAMQQCQHQLRELM